MRTRLLRLLVALGLLAITWLVALPYAANRPEMAAHIDWLDEQGVDPSAMYYTELEMMGPIFQKLALEQREVVIEIQVRLYRGPVQAHKFD